MASMRAIVITAPGGGDNLNVTEAPAPTPGYGEVLIDVAYCGCNFADTMIAKGTYPHPKGYPLIGGLEVSGRIAEVGPDVRGFAVGDAVASFLEEAGGFADQCVAPAERLVAIPDGMGLNVAASFPLQALTAWHLLHNVSVTKPGDVILLHAIGGGVVNRAPEPELPARNRHDHLVEMPRRSWPPASMAKLSGEQRPKLQDPSPHRLV
jgi:NADPH2:quinone reductase